MTLQIAPTLIMMCDMNIRQHEVERCKLETKTERQNDNWILPWQKNFFSLFSINFYLWYRENTFAELDQDEKQLTSMCVNQAKGSISCTLEIRLKEASTETLNDSVWKCSLSLWGDVLLPVWLITKLSTWLPSPSVWRAARGVTRLLCS